MQTIPEIDDFNDRQKYIKDHLGELLDAGVERISLVVVLASVAALAAFVAVRLVRGRRAQGMRLAFGPYLCGACWVNLVWGETLWRAWLDIIL